jgi:hypothetical protein
VAIQHKTSVVRSTDGDSFDAKCSCGWNDPGYEECEDAECATGEHLAEAGVEFAGDEWRKES